MWPSYVLTSSPGNIDVCYRFTWESGMLEWPGIVSGEQIVCVSYQLCVLGGLKLAMVETYISGKPGILKYYISGLSSLL